MPNPSLPQVPDAAQDDVVPPGGTQTIVLGGFQPFEMVQLTLFSTPVDLGQHRADAQGVLRLTFTVPAGLELGDHHVELVGAVTGPIAAVPFQVAGPAGPTPVAQGPGRPLAQTGSDLAGLLGLGGLALLVGAGLTVVGSRRAARR